jgi:hypothetical protein
MRQHVHSTSLVLFRSTVTLNELGVLPHGRGGECV